LADRHFDLEAELDSDPEVLRFLNRRATGAIITIKAIHELHRTGGRHALATMCIGGGQGIAAIFERT
jgi:hypothetical protein